MSAGAAQRQLWDLSGRRAYHDELVVEAPLSLRLQGRAHVVMMRTPGDDLELVTGYLWSSGVIDSLEDIKRLAPCPKAPESRLDVWLEAGVSGRSQSHATLLTSSCGVCSLSELGSLLDRPLRVAPMRLSALRLSRQLKALDEGMSLFKQTGGCHGAALLDPSGELRALFEDIGRHNAVDKALGWALRAQEGLTPRAEGPEWGLAGWSLIVSSRAGFEIVHKAARCGVSALMSVGASSSLAHELAQETGLSLFSFARGDRAHRHSAPLDLT